MGASLIRLARTRRDPLRMFVQVNGPGTAQCYGGSTPLHPLITLPTLHVPQSLWHGRLPRGERPVQR
jgi:hypothetical protein